jgi:hypothetical protein
MYKRIFFYGSRYLLLIAPINMRYESFYTYLLYVFLIFVWTNAF